MSESLIERVARAIYDTDHFSGPNYDSEPEPYKETFRVQARAAIEAMREPTPEMISNGRPRFRWSAVRRDDSVAYASNADVAHSSPLETWRRMIGAALSEGKP